MNIMDRNEYLEHLKDQNHIKIIAEYCKELNKTDDEIKEILQLCQAIYYLYSAAIQNATYYFDNKFNIIKLTDSNNNILKIY